MSESLIYSFSGGIQNSPITPYSNIIINNGIVYGTSSNGGANSLGTVWSLPLDGVGGATVLYSFDDPVTNPQGGIVLIGDTLYGTTLYSGGSHFGQFWSLPITGGSITDLYDFQDATGELPNSGIINIGGIFYGTTQQGAAYQNGCIYSLLTDGTFTNLCDFNNDVTGSGSDIDSLPVSDGVNLYGVCQYGGPSTYGTVYSVPLGGGAITVLYNFSDVDGSQPISRLVLSGSTLYGTTKTGGTFGYGVIFSISTSGTNFTILHNFAGIDGSSPTIAMILNGNTLYGGTNEGGPYTAGVIFSISTSGSNFTVLHYFQGASNDANFTNPLTLLNNTIYASSLLGGGTDEGTFYQLILNDAPCFNEGTGILCLNDNLKDVYTPIEDIRKDTLVKTYKHGYRKVTHIGKNHMINDNSKLNGSMRVMPKDENMTDDLIVTGGHSILVDKLSLQEILIHKKYKQPIEKIDDKFLLLAAASDRFKMVKNKDLYTFYHLVLDNEGTPNKKYGIWANGVLTESADLNDFKKHNLSLI